MSLGSLDPSGQNASVTPDPDQAAALVDAASYVDLAGSLPNYSQVPNKLGILQENSSQFVAIREAITNRVERLDIAKPETPDALIVLTLEANQGLLRPGFVGQNLLHFSGRLDNLFGNEHWSFKHLVNGRLLDSSYALRLYEEAYLTFFRQHPEAVEWLVSNYSDVYDNAPSNVNSGYDYEIQEVPERGRHLHDIAIRRALRELGAEFRGSEPLKIRGRYQKGGPAPGFFLSPGEVPFHRPELLPALPIVGKRWWQDASVEDFYQRSKMLEVEEFRDDTPYPSNPQNSQMRESYCHRLAARSILRLLPMLVQGEVTLGTINSLPWMLDHNSLPLDSNGLPRALQPTEIGAVLHSALEQLEGLFARSGKDDEYLLGNWTGFNRAREYLAATERFYSSGAESLTEYERGNFPEFFELPSWREALPRFWEQIIPQGKQPLFLARDGLAIMEYLSYCQDLHGLDRFDSKSTVHRAIYLPGNDSAKMQKNQRSLHPVLEETIGALFHFLQEAYAQQNLSAPPQNEHEKATLQAGFTSLITEQFDRWRTENTRLASLPIYEWWHEVFEGIDRVFDHDLSRLVVVDSDGTGKSVFFVKTLLEYFARRRGDDLTVDTLVGGLQKKHLGIPNLAEMYHIGPNQLTTTVLPDIRWPFRFSRFEGEPIFSVRANPTLTLSLLHRTMNFYNFAVEDTNARRSDL